MKKLSILAMGLLFVLTTACSVSGSGTLFDGKDSNKWKMTGDVSVQDDINDLERYGCTGRTEKRQIQKLRSDP